MRNLGELVVFIVLFLIFVVVPVIEISILIAVGEQLGALSTVALVLLTAAVGASLVRSQGLQTLMSAQQKIQNGEQPGQEMIEGLMLAMAGILLVTPGFMTDIFGLLILTPVTRKIFANYLLAKLIIKGMAANQGSFNAGFSPPPQQGEDIIEGEFVSKDHEHHLGSNIKPADDKTSTDDK
ncbi:MAG: FxsA family protein [Psychrobium sp.]|nr:FxsA family protein [Psychrobium sp.]